MIRREYWTAALLVTALAVYATMFSVPRWRQFGVPHIAPGFADMRQLLASAECARQGANVYVSNPCDEMRRPYTYSSLLLKTMVALKLDPGATVACSLVILLVFSVAAAFLLAPASGPEFLLSLAFLSSSAVLLGVERANIDLLLTAGLGLAALGVATEGAPSWGWVALGLLPGTFIKYYPALAVPGLVFAIRWRPGRAALTIGMAAAVAAYFCVFPHDIAHIRSNTPMPLQYAIEFGAIDLMRMLGAASHSHALAIALMPPVVGAAWLLGRFLPPADLPRRDRTLLFAGVSVYAFCFFLVSNWEYRRVLLALVLPGLLRYNEGLPLSKRAPGLAALGLALALCWSPLWTQAGLPGPASVTPFVALKEAMDWLFVVLIVACAAASVDRPVSVDDSRPIG